MAVGEPLVDMFVVKFAPGSIVEAERSVKVLDGVPEGYARAQFDVAYGKGRILTSYMPGARPVGDWMAERGCGLVIRPHVPAVKQQVDPGQAGP